MDTIVNSENSMDDDSRISVLGEWRQFVAIKLLKIPQAASPTESA